MKVVVLRSSEEGDDPITKMINLPDQTALEYLEQQANVDVYEIVSDSGTQIVLHRQEIDPATRVTEERVVTADFRNVN